MSKFVQLCLLICVLPGLLLRGDCIEDDDEECVYTDNICLNSWDVSNYEAIRTLHAQLDDDHNGGIDLSESVEFLREELNYTKEAEKRQNFFHPNNDQHISVNELWTMWITSEVHNWTVENTVSWLCLNVELFQYADVFTQNGVNGSLLPRLATNNDQFLTRILSIKNPAHRSKIAIKAMDVVLFGPPKDTGSYLKDATIVLLITFLIIGAFRFYRVQRNFERQRVRMMEEMETLNAEERKFREELQLKSPFLEENKDICSNEQESPDSNQSDSASAVKWSIEEDCESATTTETSSPLQMWLQLSYERERAAFDGKCQLVEAQLREAKDMCEKLHPSKKQFFATLGLVHGKTEPKYDAITEAVRESIAQIKLMHKEMDYRWNAIEKWTGCDITINAGLTHLEFLLEPEIHCQGEPTSSTAVGLGQGTLGFKSSNMGTRRRRKEKSSPETGSIRSTCSLPVQTSIRSGGSIHQSQTASSALGNTSPDIAEVGKELNQFDVQQTNHSPVGISSINAGSNSQLASESKKNADVSGTADAADSNPPGNTLLPQNDSKFKSEPTLETDGSISSETATELIVNGTELRRSKLGSFRRSKFFRSKIFDKLKAKTEKTSKIDERT